MIQKERIRRLNNKPIKNKQYILYWMQAAQRTEYNHALEYSIQKANLLKQPIVVLFGITDSYPQANLRHYQFMLEGLKEVHEKLSSKGIKFIVRKQSPEKAVLTLSKQASMIIVDAGHTRIQRRWRGFAARNLDCLLEEVETNLIVPITEASDKENFSAGTFRPRIKSKLHDYLLKMKHSKPIFKSLNMTLKGLNISNPSKVLANLDIDDCVPPSFLFTGGTTEAKRRLRDFSKNKLDCYDEARNDPSLDATSNLSPYLHFGQISPLYIALEIMKSHSPGKDAYLEELIVRRELSYNFIFYNQSYDKFTSLPSWAVKTINQHNGDKREYIYSKTQFEKADTHDPYWNAAQKEMLITGKMHGYMRMYWGKKILEWSKTPAAGFKIALALNNKYELDGRDPNGFTGVAWCFGKHDRAWGERKIFGKVRYMNAKGLERKFKPELYVDKIANLEKEFSKALT